MKWDATHFLAYEDVVSNLVNNFLQFQRLSVYIECTVNDFSFHKFAVRASLVAYLNYILTAKQWNVVFAIKFSPLECTSYKHWTDNCLDDRSSVSMRVSGISISWSSFIRRIDLGSLTEDSWFINLSILTFFRRSVMLNLRDSHILKKKKELGHQTRTKP